MIYYQSGQIKIRSMEKEDAKTIYDTYNSYGWEPDIATYERYFREQSEDKRTTFVAEWDNITAGHVSLIYSPRPGQSGPFLGIPLISDLCVFYSYHNRGIATALLDCAEKLSAENNDTICLGVGCHSGYGAAQRLYVKRGYVFDGSGVWYKGKQLEQYAPCVNDDDLILWMSKKLY